MVRAMTDETQKAGARKAPRSLPQPRTLTDGIEDKSLERVAEESKSAEEAGDPAPVVLSEDPAAPDNAPIQEQRTDDETSVTLIHHVSIDGEEKVPGDEVTVPTRVAQKLLSSRRARLTED